MSKLFELPPLQQREESISPSKHSVESSAPNEKSVIESDIKHDNQTEIEEESKQFILINP